MHSAAMTLVARGCVKAHQRLTEHHPDQVPHWAVAVFGMTAILYFITLFRVEYIYGRILPTLLMIESPADAITFESLPTDEDQTPTEKTAFVMPKSEAAPKNEFTTSSFRATRKLLKVKGSGRFSRFRGLLVFFVESIAIEFTRSSIKHITRLPLFIATMGAAVLCANLSMAWTHVVITENSPKPWYRRINMTLWRKIALPTAVFVGAQQVTALVSGGLAFVMMRDQFHGSFDHKSLDPSLIWKGSIVILVALVLVAVLIFPAHVMLRRVQASLIDDTEETIVPFDRSFNGKVVPQALGGTGVLSMVDAWTTFDCNARKRLLIAYAKVFAVQLGVTMLYTSVLLAEVFIILGPNWEKFVPKGPPHGTVPL